MRVPIDVAKKACAGAGLGLGFSCDADGRVTKGFEPLRFGPYPPPGYLAWNRLDVGNGDTYGYYWPIGCEEGDPLVCTTMHDAWALEPVASGLAEAVRLHLIAHHASPD